MGTLIVLLLILFLIFWFPYMLIKWAIFGRGLFFPDFERMSKKLSQDSIHSNYEPGCWLMLNYYTLLIFTSAEYTVFVYVIYKIIHSAIEYFNLNSCLFFNVKLIFFFLLFLYPILQPVWFFIKLAQWGNGFFRPDFEEMKNQFDNRQSKNSKGFFAYNQLGGRIKYYIQLLYFILFSSIILFLIYRIIHVFILNYSQP